MNQQVDGLGPVGPEGAATCAGVRDALPLCGLGLLSTAERIAVEAHLAGCAECRAEDDLVRALQAAACEPPAGLAERILAAAEASEAMPAGAPGLPRRAEAPTRPGRWLWALPAAAMVVLALGIGVLWNGGSSQEFLTIALEPEATTRWFGNDWVVADEPQLQALPDEVLRQVLLEMGP